MNKKGFTFARKEASFTLIELLVVIAVVVTLAVVVFVALNPSQRIKSARDAKRTSDVDSILTAIHTSILDNKGLPTNMPVAGTEAQLGTAATGCIIATGGCSVAGTVCVDLMTGTNNLTKHLKSMPIDPNGGLSTITKYSVVVDTNGIVTVKACGVEGATNISASR